MCFLHINITLMKMNEKLTLIKRKKKITPFLSYNYLSLLRKKQISANRSGNRNNFLKNFFRLIKFNILIQSKIYSGLNRKLCRTQIILRTQKTTFSRDFFFSSENK